MKKSELFWVVLFIVATVLISTGCTSAEAYRAQLLDPASSINNYKLVDTFIDKSIPLEQHSRLYVEQNALIGAFDESSPLKGVAESQSVMVFPSGTHIVKIKAKDIYKTGNWYPLLSFGIEVTGTFLPGHSYIATGDVTSGLTPALAKVTVEIKDIEDILKKLEEQKNDASTSARIKEVSDLTQKQYGARIINTNEKLKALQ
jgi:hypothetical protein